MASLEKNPTDALGAVAIWAGLVLFGLAGFWVWMHGLEWAYRMQGALVLGWCALTGVFLILKGFAGPRGTEGYFDGPTRVGIPIAIAWGIFGFSVGDYLAWQLAYPALNGDLSWLNFGRLRPVHTTAVIFGFGGNALIATSFYVVQRTSRARLYGRRAPWFVLWGYNLFCVLAVSGYLLGITSSKEYAEPEWYADILLTIVWVTYFYIYVMTLARRREPHIYVSNWYYLAFIVVVAMLHIVNNISMPASLLSYKSYSAYAGVQDAVIQWWYGHNAVAFFLTAGFLGMLYYFLPKKAERPVYSYRLSILGFWGITFLYIWVGTHHLHFTAVPDWAQTLGMAFSIMLLVPSWAAAFNAIMTLNGAWARLRTESSLRFMFAAAVFYAMSTFEGSFLAVTYVNSLSHYTDWTVAHVHSGALGWVALITMGSIYALVPWLFNRPGMYSERLVAWHFWLAMAGILLYLAGIWNSGILQGLMWRTYDAAGFLKYSFMESVTPMHPYYVIRGLGGLLFVAGSVVMAVNVWLTLRMPQTGRDPSVSDDRPLVPAEAR